MPFDGTPPNPAALVVDLMIEWLANPSHWTRGRMREYDPNKAVRMCMVGALRTVIHDTPWADYRVARIVKKTIAEVIIEIVGDDYSLSRRVSWIFPSALIMQFNDDSRMSHGDVMTVLRTARQRLR